MGHHGRMQTQHGVAIPSPPETDASVQRHPRNFSVRSRHSALSATQRRTWQRLWPELGAEGHRWDRPGPTVPLDMHGWFGRDAPVVLEIGSGAGTSTVAMARAEPDVDVVAVEVYQRGLAQLLCAIEREGPESLRNIRLIRGDALDVLEHLIAPMSLIGVRVFFPDPWPKARHHKRRLLQPDTIALIAERLRPGGVLHAATDHPGYAERIAEAGDAEPRLSRVTPGAALPISVALPGTKYQAKARAAGSAVTELVWQKRR
ncbi:MAG TPA: tRNA (guanosine(46)-N7)-methyltransferase TrmB [Mycobacterium sp.]|nr:tRNA (guanosine(46)-N7)-methyltransferase TrmB [Mycobacterium sp.]